MANSAVVTSLAAGKVSPNAYLGTVKWIPIVFTTDGTYSATAMVFSEVLPPGTYLIDYKITTTAIASGVLDIGYTGDADAIYDDGGSVITSPVTLGYTGSPVDVGGKQLIGTLTGTMSSDTIKGYFLVVNNA